MSPENPDALPSAPCFPADMRFCFEWRSYQARVLNELDQHLDDAHLHVVAAPGSGKTVLGIEVVRRLGQPALVLSPTITIRNQWADRLAQCFLPENGRPDWVSTRLDRPGLFTAATYQALHMALTGRGENGDNGEEAEEGNGHRSSEAAGEAAGTGMDLIAVLLEAGVRTLVVDECHHLRTEWWKSLVEVKERLPDLRVVALTATPPYDVPPAEWENYRSLCGPIDAEISVPELVREGNLCPHQDYVMLSLPSEEEQARIDQIRRAGSEMLEGLVRRGPLYDCVTSLPGVKAPAESVEGILDDPEFYSSVVIYLNAVDGQPPRELVEAMGMTGRRIPELDRNWMQALLTGCLFTHEAALPAHAEYLDGLRRDLARAGVVEHRRVELAQPKEITKALTRSISKLDSIRDIAVLERDALGSDLRMVVLTDFIRRDDLPAGPGDQRALTRLGVVPIFERLRRTEAARGSLGILCGSLTVIPSASGDLLLECAEALGMDRSQVTISPLPHDASFCSVQIPGDGEQHAVSLITELFRHGGVRVLVGTAALLGEGWDAPFVNTLVLASYVGSFMLSNQMRGRAIRSVRDDPIKTANIWHLAAVEPKEATGGADFDTLRRRFAAFVGVSADGQRIENAMGRLGLPRPPFSAHHIDDANSSTMRKARDRQRLRDEWKNALQNGDGVVDEVEMTPAALPRRAIISNTLLGLFYEGIAIAVYVFSQLSYETDALGLAALIAAAIGLPTVLKSLWLFLKHGTVEGSMRSVGEAIKRSLHSAGSLRSPLADLRVHAARREDYSVSVWLTGGSSYERALFQDVIHEFVGPIDNPRYILRRSGRFWKARQTDYHPVPKVLGQRREQAECLLDEWRRNVGAAELIYTRTTEGRRALIAAREHSLAAAFQRRSERRSAWR